MKDIINTIKTKAKKDLQIDTSGIFENFTDFQNVMLSDLSLIDLLWEKEELDLCKKSIGDLYLENIKDNVVLEYENIIFDGNELLEMTKKENNKIYKSLVLGKLVRYGFYDIKIIEKISGENGFDVLVLEDKKGNIMIYFPCTNVIEIDDYLYDCYPIMNSLLKKGKLIGNITKSKKIHESQQKQAKEILIKYLNKKNIKIHVSGFSLGGSLAEYSYLNAYNDYSNVLGNLVLFNPYHNLLTKEEAIILKESNKLKLYVCEGDLVSTIFNYPEFKNIAKPIYINYQNNFSNSKKLIDNKDSILNLVVNNIKNNYCDNIIKTCKNLQKKKIINMSLYFILKSSEKKLNKIKKRNIDGIELIKGIKPIIEKIGPKIKKFGVDLENDYNLDFINNFHYLEIIFTSTHLTYTVDYNKLTSFDTEGKIKKEIKIGNETYIVKYPSFDKTSTELFGSNPYKELSNIIANTKK